MGLRLRIMDLNAIRLRLLAASDEAVDMCKK